MKNIKNRTEVEREELSFLLSLGDCPVGGSSVGGSLYTFLKKDYIAE